MFKIKKNNIILIVSIGFLLFLNLGSSILIKVSPSYYGNTPELIFIIFSVGIIYFLRTLLWLFIGKRYQISYVYAFLGLNYILSFFIGMSFFNELFNQKRLLGCVIITAGVVILSFSKNRDENTHVQGAA